MSEDWEKTEGVLLQSIPYLNRHRILKVFTPHAGLLTLIIKYIGTKSFAATHPFCRSEWVYRKSRGDIHPVRDASLLDPLDELKKNYTFISAAGSIASDLLQSQLPQRSAPILYDLLLASLKHLPRNPDAVAQSFRLKLLQFEGLLHLRPQCSRCDHPSSRLFLGECLCFLHAAADAFFFSSEEWELLLRLGLSRRFSDLDLLQPSTAFADKTKRLFFERIRQ